MQGTSLSNYINGDTYIVLIALHIRNQDKNSLNMSSHISVGHWRHREEDEHLYHEGVQDSFSYEEGDADLCQLELMWKYYISTFLLGKAF